MRHLIGLVENSWASWKDFWNICNFILLLTEDDSALKVTSQITFLGLVANKPFANKNSVMTIYKAADLLIFS